MTKKEKLLVGLEHCMSNKIGTCTDCPYREQCYDRDAMDDIILFHDAYDLLKNSGWIDADEQLPTPVQFCLCDRSNAVLAYTPGDDMIRVAWYLGKDWRGHHKWIVPSARNGYHYLTQRVTYWCPLPEAPLAWRVHIGFDETKKVTDG